MIRCNVCDSPVDGSCRCESEIIARRVGAALLAAPLLAIVAAMLIAAILGGTY